MMVSKLKPRLERERVRFAVVILESKDRAQDDHHGNDVDGPENSPFDADGLMLVALQVRPHIQDGDAHPVDGVEDGAEEHNQLKKPVLIQQVDETYPCQRHNVK